MLMISRHGREGVRVDLGNGRYGWVVVTEVFERTVRLGFAFPRDVVLERHELLDPAARAAAPIDFDRPPE